MVIVSILPTDAQLVAAPSHARNVAIIAARARTKSDVTFVEMFAGLLEKLQFMNEALSKCFSGDAFGLNVVSGNIS